MQLSENQEDLCVGGENIPISIATGLAPGNSVHNTAYPLIMACMAIYARISIFTWGRGISTYFEGMDHLCIHYGQAFQKCCDYDHGSLHARSRSYRFVSRSGNILTIAKLTPRGTKQVDLPNATHHVRSV